MWKRGRNPEDVRPAAADPSAGRRLLARRQGKVLVLFALMLPALLGVIGLVVDGSLMMVKHRNLQHFADIAASAAAMDLLRGESNATAIATANWQISRNHISNADVTVNIPPTAGPYLGDSRYVEVIISRPVKHYIIQVVGGASSSSVGVQSVAGYEQVTTGAAVVVLEPQPPAVTISAASPLYPSLAANSAGLEFLGSSALEVTGAVLVNTEWGGVDENGDPAGNGPGPPYGIRCPVDHIHAADVRVAGGVDVPSKYESLVAGATPPLQANRFPVSDPFESLPVPTESTDYHVDDHYRGGLTANPGDELKKGVYDWIDVPSGDVEFNHGVFIIRGVNPATGLALNIRGDDVIADRVLFYITDSAAYSVTTGLPDALDGGTSPAAVMSATMTPSVVIDVGISCSFKPIGHDTGPYKDILIFQRRHDRRPIIIYKPHSDSTSPFSGDIYAKWGHLIFAGGSTVKTRLVAGSMRIINLGGLKIAPDVLLPWAEDVFLVQ